MTAIDDKGEVVNLRVGQAICGMGFRTIAITFEDTQQPGFQDWLNDHILHRLLPPWVKR